MNRWIVGLGVMAMAVAAARAADDGVGRIAVVNLDRLIKSHPDTPFAESVLKQQAEEFEAGQKDLQAQGEKLRDELETLNEQTEDRALSEAARAEKKTQLKDKLLAYKEYDRRAREKARKLNLDYEENKLRLREQIVKKIREVIVRCAEEKGIVLVVDSSAPAATRIEPVIYFADRIDLTDEVFKQMGGKDAKAEKSAEGKKDGK